MTRKNRWKHKIGGHEMKVLDNVDGLKISVFANEDLDDLAECHRILKLELVNSRGAAIDLQKIAHIDALRSLELQRVSPATLEPLCELANLEALWLNDMKLPDLEPLCNVARLERLSISGCRVANLQQLQSLPALKKLNLTDCRLKFFSAELCLPRLEWLNLSRNELSDLGFLRTYTNVEWLELDNNAIVDIAPLADCAKLRRVSLRANPIADLTLLKKLQNVESLIIDHSLEQAAEQAGLHISPVPKVEERAPDPRPAQLVDRIVAGDWEYLNAQDYDELIGRSFGSAIETLNTVPKLEAVRAPLVSVLRNVDDKLFVDMCRATLQVGWVHLMPSCLELLAEVEERLPPVLLAVFERELRENPGDSSSGLLKGTHRRIAELLRKVGSPEYTPLYRRYLEERRVFSNLGLKIFKELLKSVAKSRDHELTEPLIDLLTCETRIIGGDATFVKQCLKAIKALGDAGDIPALSAAFDFDAESRGDVRKVYTETVERLARKKSKSISDVVT